MKRIITLVLITLLMVTSLTGCFSFSYESNKQETTEKTNDKDRDR